MKPADCKTAEDWIAVYRGQVDEISAKLAELSGVALAWKLRADIAEAEVVRLQNAARSRLRCPSGHSPSQSRGPCWYCDAQRNAELLAGLTAEIDAKGGAVSARDLLGMWDVARLRADNAEADAKTLRAELAELLPLWPQRDHGSRCKAPFDQRAECTCPAYEANLARGKALKLIGVPNGR